jgi:hypothetical protein
MLFGLPNFYRSLGFAPLFRDHAARIDTLRALRTRMPQGIKARRMKPGDIPAILRIHAAHGSAWSCAVVRTQAHLSNRWHAWGGAMTLIDDQGRARGYFLPRPAPDALEVDEAGLADDDAFNAVLASSADLAHDLGLPWIRFYAPAETPFMQRLAAMGSCESVLPPSLAEALMAVVNVGETMESMLPEWEARLQPEAALLGEAEVTLLIERHPHRIRAHRGAIDVTPVYGRNKLSVSRVDFAQLLAGARSVDEELKDRHAALSPAARRLLHLIFPPRNAYIWRQDRF